MRRIVLSLALLLATGAQAGETRTAPEGHVPPPATAEQLAWLSGIWTGAGIGGAPATEAYSAPGGGSVAGHFVQQDGEGGVEFLEIMQIAEINGSLVYRLKHFSGALDGWEERDEHVSFALVAIEPGAVYFDGLTLRREGDTLTSAVRVAQRDGTVEEYVFRYRKLAGADAASACPAAVTTPEVDACIAAGVDRANERMAQYLAAALARHAARSEVVAGIRASQAAFLAYRQEECDAVHQDWAEGTIRTSMSLGCTRRLTDERTLALWRNWLTYMDSTPPVLPEPTPRP